MNQTPRLGLSYVMPAQAQKHLTVNETFRLLDVLVQSAVVSASVAAEPAAPTEGDAYILPTGRTGASWSAMAAERIAVFSDGGFAEIAPPAGQVAFVRDEARLLVFDGSAWIAAAGGGEDQAPLFGINTAADAVNRLAVKSDAELLTHDDVTPGSGDARKVINKAGLGNTAAILFQTGFSGRAEIGLVGDDALAFKVSADGATFREALRIDAASGHVGIGRSAPAARLHVGAAADPALRLQEDGTASYAELVHKAPGQTVLGHVSESGAAVLDLCPRALDGAGAATLRLFRDTATLGTAGLDIHVGDGSALTNHRLNGNGHSYLATAYGSVRIGDNAVPAVTLDVAGPVKVGAYSVATLPPASKGIGQIVYVTNASGGAVPAFSDGGSWRRVTDRVVVS